MTDLVAIADEEFPELTPKQREFCAAYVANSGKGTEAAKAAGYAPKSARVEAHRLLQSQRVIQCIHHLTVRALGAAAPAALGTVVRLSTGARSEYVQLEAAKDVLDRVGMTAPKKLLVGGGIDVRFDFG